MSSSQTDYVNECLEEPPPCLNGGKCHSFPPINFICVCASGFKGRHCEESKLFQSV